ncbi:MAG: DsrE family protein, partial [Rhodospirillales bacterium]|nr:DsrE family protein [Rhodospirillales bacterium]
MSEPEETPDDPVVKRFLYVNRKAPHGTVYALEELEMVLIAAMFEQDVHVVFLDDGVFQIKKNQ